MSKSHNETVMDGKHGNMHFVKISHDGLGYILLSLKL